MEYNEIREFLIPLIGYLNLLGVLLLFSGIILGASASAARSRENRLASAKETPPELP